MELTTSEFFCNMKNLPPRGSQESIELAKWEEEKCLGGITVNGIYIPGWLYFHINHWWIRRDAKDNFGNITRIEGLPYLRDNEWIRAEALEQCKTQMKGYMEVGLRQGGKSEFEASVTGYNALLFRNTQNVIVGGNDSDLSLLKDKIDFGLKKMWKGLAIPRLDKDWRRPMVRLGYKTTDNEDDVWSYLMIRNSDDGKNTEAPAGTTAKSFVMDEVGKYLFGQVFSSGKEAFISEFGWRTIPILVATGGSFDKGADAQRFFNNPDANNFLGFLDPVTGKRTCLFMDGTHRQDCKYDTNLFEYLSDTGVIISPQDVTELEKIPMKVSDKEKARKKIQEERLLKSKDPDKTEYLKAIMYQPLTVEECFLSAGDNIFNIEFAKRQQDRVYKEDITGIPCEMFVDEKGDIHHKFSDKLPISSFPMKSNESPDAPVVMWEPPMQNPPYALYVAGVDPYRQGQAKYSTSLGAVYIYKRMHSITSEKYQDMFVASYVARPDRKEVWNEQARWLIKYYNALTLVENDDMSFIDYMIAMGDAPVYLQRQPQWLKDIVPASEVHRDYGIHRSSDKIRDFLHTCYKKYTEEPILTEKDENNVVTRQIFGMSRIFDPMLLQETITYNEDGNFDRIIAAELAIAMAYKLDPIIGRVSGQNDRRIEELYSRKNGSPIYTKQLSHFDQHTPRKRKTKQQLFL